MDNDYKSSLNMSYEYLLNCNLSELEYWGVRGEELLHRAEERYEKSKG